jgi:putative oxidoreductase
MRIELDDTPQSWKVSLGQALVRSVLGGVALAHGLDKLLQPAHFAAVLARWQLPEAETIATVALSLELTIGVALLVGRFTRTAAFLLLCDRALNVAWLVLPGPLSGLLTHTEALALTIACCVFFMIVGGGPLSLDHMLRRRARLRAIANDEIWSRPPYVASR